MPPVCWTVRSASQRTIALDGKVLRRSFDNFTDRKAAQLLRVRHQSRPGPGAYRYRREVKRDPRRPAIAWRTPGRAQHHHARCTALPSLRGRRASPGACHYPTEGQSAHPAAKCRNRLRIPPSHQQRHLDHHRAFNRHEARTADVFSADRVVANTEWKPRSRIVRITRDVLHQSAKTGLRATRRGGILPRWFRVSASHSATAIPKPLARRGKLHYTRDVTFQEDQSRIRHQRCVRPDPQLRFNILRRNQTRTFSQDRRRCARRTFDAIAKWCIS